MIWRDVRTCLNLCPLGDVRRVDTIALLDQKVKIHIPSFFLCRYFFSNFFSVVCFHGQFLFCFSLIDSFCFVDLDYCKNEIKMSKILFFTHRWSSYFHDKWFQYELYDKRVLK